MNTAPEQNSSVAVTVNGIDGDCLVLQTEAGETLRWPRQKAPKQINLTSPLTISFNSESINSNKTNTPKNEQNSQSKLQMLEALIN